MPDYGRPPPPPRAPGGFPWATLILLASFVAVFALEQRLALAPPGQGMAPAVATLAALGGLSRDLAMSGEWWRMCTAPFLHGGLSHLIGNGLVFLFAGMALERQVGHAWLICIFAVGALAGSTVSMLVLNPATVSVGASGAILAMVVALYMVSYRLPPGRGRNRIRYRSLRVAIPSLIPMGHGVDYGAHFGGAIFGAVVGFLLLRTWEEDDMLPGLRIGAAACAAGAVLSFSAAGYAVAQNYSGFSHEISDLIPAGRYPHTGAEIAARADGLLVSYARDPRSYLLVAVLRMSRRDWPSAEQALRLGLKVARPEGRSPAELAMLPPSLPNTMRVMLGESLLAEGRRSEAALAVRDACAAEGSERPPADVVATLVRSGLCGA